MCLFFYYNSYEQLNDLNLDLQYANIIHSGIIVNIAICIINANIIISITAPTAAPITVPATGTNEPIAAPPLAVKSTANFYLFLLSYI